MNDKKSTRGQVNAVVDILGLRIAANHYHEGETLPVEQELADSLTVGRNALREAVKVLSGKGLISTTPRAGTRIRSREEWNMLDPDVLRWHVDPNTATEKFMLDLIEMRRLIEPKAAELAALRGGKEDVANILAAYEDMAAASSNDQSRTEADIAFHSAILKASQNQVFNYFRFAIATYLKAHSRLGQAASEQELLDDLERHHQMAWAIASGKAKAAHALAVEILNSNLQHFEEK